MQGTAAATAAPPPAQPEGGEPTVAPAGVENPVEEVEGEVDNVQLRRLVQSYELSVLIIIFLQVCS